MTYSRNKSDSDPKEILRPEELPYEIREYMNQNADFYNWLAAFQHSPEYLRMDAKEREDVYLSIYQSYRRTEEETDIQGSERVYFDFFLPPEDAATLHSHLDQYGLTLEEFVMQSLTRQNPSD